MKIAFLIGPTVSGRKNGVVSQALTWREGLIANHGTVDLISPWDDTDWQTYDAVHVFGTGFYLDVVKLLKAHGVKKIVLSPILDSNRNEQFLRLLSHLNVHRIGFKTAWRSLREALGHADAVLARSHFEADKIHRIFGVHSAKIHLCRLPVRFQADDTGSPTDRQLICSHVSVLSSQNKNVMRLIEAAERFGFSLQLAGRINDLSFGEALEKITEVYSNISYLGVLSDGELRELYRRSRVFALPSLVEGVGLVALEAALDGADIVITERGGPVEYYGGMAQSVDPLDVDAIGNAVVTFLNGKTYQPKLALHIRSNYSVSSSVKILRDVYSP